MASITIGFALALTLASAHSWLECTDYRVTPGSAATKVWDKSLCLGHARCGQRQAAEGFGIDTGFNFRSRGPSGCQCAQSRDNYDGIARAQYTPGQRVCLAYPSKNHVAAPCTNVNIPDTGVVITRSGRSAGDDHDDSVAQHYAHGNGDHVAGEADYKGFQNCPNFCADMDKSLCTMCFDLEDDLAPGTYTFRWVWAFNTADETYASCWEADVRADASAANDFGPGKVHAPEGDATSPAMAPAPVNHLVASVTTIDDEWDCDSDDVDGHEEFDCDDEDSKEEIELNRPKEVDGEAEGGEDEDCDELPEPMVQHESYIAAPAAPLLAPMIDTPPQHDAALLRASDADTTRCGVQAD